MLQQRLGVLAARAQQVAHLGKRHRLALPEVRYHPLHHLPVGLRREHDPLAHPDDVAAVLQVRQQVVVTVQRGRRERLRPQRRQQLPRPLLLGGVRPRLVAGQGDAARRFLHFAPPGPERDGLIEGAALQPQPAAQLLPGDAAAQGELPVVGREHVAQPVPESGEPFGGVEQRAVSRRAAVQREQLAPGDRLLYSGPQLLSRQVESAR